MFYILFSNNNKCKKNAALKEPTAEVNAVSTTGGRLPDQVRKQLTDQKSKSRKKAVIIRRHRMATEGGSPCRTRLATRRATSCVYRSSNHLWYY